MRDKGHLTEDQLQELEQENREEEAYYVASQWKLIWWKFRKHKLSMASGVVLIILYLLAGFCEFVSMYSVQHTCFSLNCPSQVLCIYKVR